MSFSRERRKAERLFAIALADALGVPGPDVFSVRRVLDEKNLVVVTINLFHRLMEHQSRVNKAFHKNFALPGTFFDKDDLYTALAAAHGREALTEPEIKRIVLESMKHVIVLARPDFDRLAKALLDSHTLNIPRLPEP